ncbi:hypothetical protein OQJ26_12120 [Legionella sp. PATHC038]|uniref:hypothetical protein n=1 Tax=Legionella sheltonii TaxID=2992041 RepID=UPI0022448C0E|nr:hypothetical protein [Legionella sp. PATHC038]MCW8399538.1 hypothetical protein [Legionella sp. PATHC038]
MPKFVEVEHKFCFDNKQSFKKAESAILRLYPLRDYKVDVAERYFIIDGLNNFIIRHKVDEEKQSLTLKSFTPGKDSQTRLEVEISLAQEQGDQLQTVEKFLTVFNSYKEYKLMKHLQVFLFPEAEVVLYQAITQDRELYALEIESVKESKYQALKHIKQFELQLGLDVRKREKRCLFELLFPYR